LWHDVSLRGRRDRGTAAGNSSHPVSPVIQKISNNEALIISIARIENSKSVIWDPVLL
jgi:hypothetical protein